MPGAMPLRAAIVQALLATSAASTCTLFAGNAGGQPGAGLSELNSPWDILVDTSDDVYVSDASNHRVLRFPGDGAASPELFASANAPHGLVRDGSDILISEYGPKKVTRGPSGGPRTDVATGLSDNRGIALDENGDLIVAESSANKVSKFFGTGAKTSLFPNAGFNWPTRVRVNSAGEVYVVDTSNQRIMKFPAGATTGSGTVVAGGQGAGSRLDQLENVHDVAEDQWGNLLVADTNNGRIMLWRPGASEGEVVVGSDELQEPIAVFFDSRKEFFYVADIARHVVLKCVHTSTTTTSSATESSTSSTSRTETASSTSSQTSTATTTSSSLTESSTSSTSRTSSSSSTSSQSSSTTTMTMTTTSSTSTESSTSSSRSGTSTSGTSTSSQSSSPTTTSSAETSSPTSTRSSSSTSSATSSLPEPWSSSSSSSLSTLSMLWASWTSWTSTTPPASSWPVWVQTTSSSAASSLPWSMRSTAAKVSPTWSSSLLPRTTPPSEIPGSEPASRLSSTTSGTSAASGSEDWSATSMLWPSWTSWTSTAPPASSWPGTTETTSSSATSRSSWSMQSAAAKVSPMWSSSLLPRTAFSSEIPGNERVSSTTSGTSAAASSENWSSPQSSPSSSTTSGSTSSSATTATSSASSTTESQTQSTSTSTTPTTPEEPVKALLEAVDELSKDILAALKAGEESRLVTQLPEGGTMAVSGLGSLVAEALAALKDSKGDENWGAAGEEALQERQVPSVRVEAPDTGVNVALPVSIFASLQVAANLTPADVALAVTALERESAALDWESTLTEEEGGAKVDVLGAATIDLWNLGSKEVLNITGLRDPIEFSLPVNFTPGMQCAFWDAAAKAWSKRGVWASRANVEGGSVLCKTRHLSLFGVLLESLLQQLLCTNVLNLLNKEALREVLAGDWTSKPSALTFASVLLLLALNFLAAAIVDWQRGRRHRFQDSFLLAHLAAPGATPTPPPARPASQGLLTCGVWAQESDVLRQALDDILSSWCQSFAEIRTVVEELMRCIAVDLPVLRNVLCACRLSALTHNVAVKTMLFLSRRVVAAQLGLSEDMVAFVLDDEDLRKYLTEAMALCEGDWRSAPDQAAAMSGLRQEVTEQVLSTIGLQGHGRHSIVKTFCRLVLTQNPIGALFVLDVFSSCKQRALVFSAQLLGALAVSCAFFEASGMARGKAKGQGQEGCGEEGEAELVASLARFIVIAMGCLLLAALPVQLLSSLQTKGFRLMQSPPGSQAWRRQLKAWRLQERLVLLLGTTYIAACTGYILLFLANIGDDDHQEWSIAGVVTLVQDVLLLPLGVAVLAPLLAQAVLHLHLRISTTSRAAFVRAVRERLHESSNAMLPIEQL